MTGYIRYSSGKQNQLIVEFIELKHQGFHSEMDIIYNLLNQVPKEIGTTLFIFTFSSPCVMCIDNYYHLIQDYPHLKVELFYKKVFINNIFSLYKLE